jgi:hypothetical protein
MTQDYVTVREEKFNILGHEVKAVTELFSDEYLDSDRFQSRCLRCCFYNERDILYRTPCLCDYIKCNGFSCDRQTHFEIIN